MSEEGFFKDAPGQAPPIPGVPLSLAPAAGYTAGQVRVRIRAYVAIAGLMSMSAGVLDLAAMTDGQLAAITPLRWTLKLLLLLISVSLAGLNAFRAAIDRSTASPGQPEPAAAPLLPA